MNQGFVGGETQYSLYKYSILHTEVDVICQTFCETVDILPMTVSEYIPHLC